MINGPNMAGPVSTAQSNMLQNSMVGAQPISVPSAYQPPLLNNSRVNHLAPFDIPRDPYAQQSNIGIGLPGATLGRQPVIKLNGQSVEVAGQLRDAARNMSYTPVQINPMGNQNYDLNSNYAMEATQVGGVKTFFDPKIMDLDMDTSMNHTPKINTFTYGNMMHAGGPLAERPRNLAY
jgi:hypothetical protein